MRLVLSVRPLVVRCGALGDMVLITVLIRALAERFGNAVDVLTSGPWSEPLLRGQPGVGEIISVRSRKAPYWLSPGQQRAVRQLRARRPDAVWYCDGNGAAWGMLNRGGITNADAVDVKDLRLLPGEHATQQWRRLARLTPGVGALNAAMASMAAAGGCHLEVSAQQAADLDRWLRLRDLQSARLIAVQIGNKRTMRRGLRRLAVNNKYWPFDRWAAVLRHIRGRHPDHAIVLLGTGPEYRLNGELAALADVGGIYNLADDLPISRLIALLSRTDALLSVDSGPAHVAAAVDCPQVVLFGKASIALYRPWGTGEADVKALAGHVNGVPDMMGIDTRQVISAWDGLRLRARSC